MKSHALPGAIGNRKELPSFCSSWLRQVEIGTWFGSEDRGGYGKHFGPVYSVKRNPFHVKFFLSVGDWCAKMWMEELKGQRNLRDGHECVFLKGFRSRVCSVSFEVGPRLSLVSGVSFLRFGA